VFAQDKSFDAIFETQRHRLDFWLFSAATRYNLYFLEFSISILIMILILLSFLDVLVAKKKVEGDNVKKEKDQLYKIISMLIGLIRAKSERNV
jgi:hypothetical protein